MGKIAYPRRSIPGISFNTSLHNFGYKEINLEIIFAGSEPRMIDFMVWPWFERFHATEKLVNQIFISDGSMPNLTAYMDRMMSVPAVQKCRLSTENHLEFYQSVKNGAPNYNVGL